MQGLRRSDLCRGLSEADVTRVAAAARPITAPAGSVVYAEHDPALTMYIIVSGQMQFSLAVGSRNGEPTVDFLGPGDHFGDIEMLTQQPRASSATALVETRLLELDLPRFNELLEHVPGFSVNISRRLVWRLHRQTTRNRGRRQPSVVAVVRPSDRTQSVIQLVAQGLAERGDAFQVLSDRVDRWPEARPHLVERMHRNPPGEDPYTRLADRIHQALAQRTRVLLDISPHDWEAGLERLLTPCEEIWWLIEPAEMTAPVDRLRRILSAAPELAGRIHVVWILHDLDRFAPEWPADLKVHERDFKVMLDDRTPANSRLQRHSIDRLVRHLRGTRLGLALGGGGARGMAHFGVLRALEREGISFDFVAGASSGALFGLSYAGGWEPDAALAEYIHALTPSKWWRLLPNAHRMFMVFKFRTGAWDRMLRPFAKSIRLEQCSIPFYTVCADLVTGNQVIRDRGDAVHAVLESINVPGISKPILRDGLALVDGAIVNNVPADILPERGADFILGVDVVTKLQPRFAGNTPDTTTQRMKMPGSFATLLRVSDVQAAAISAFRTSAVDLMIAPDASAYDFADFSSGGPISDIGEAAMLEAMPRLRQMLAELETR